MIYTSEEKKEMDAIYKRFKDYINDNTYFDIIYSDKAGYIQIILESDEIIATKIDSADDMLEMLFHEMLSDVIFA